MRWLFIILIPTLALATGPGTPAPLIDVQEIEFTYPDSGSTRVVEDVIMWWAIPRNDSTADDLCGDVDSIQWDEINMNVDPCVAPANSMPADCFDVWIEYDLTAEDYDSVLTAGDSLYTTIVDTLWEYDTTISGTDTTIDSTQWSIYWDSTQFWYDTIYVQKDTDFLGLFRVEMNLWMSTYDGLYDFWDSLAFVTRPETIVHPNTFPVTCFSSTSTITGIRSAGLDVYSTKSGRVVTSDTLTEINQTLLFFSFDWSGLRAGYIDSAGIYGKTVDGRYSDTTWVHRFYIDPTRGVFVPR